VADLVAGSVTVRAPATSANLGPGFDSLALCLDLADVVTAEVTRAGTEVVIVGEGAAELPSDDTNLVVKAIRGALDSRQVPQPGLRLTCRNAIPQGRGLGSSAAAIVAGLRLAESLVGGVAVGDEEALVAATALEGHVDNVAACLLGGLVVAWTEQGGPRAVRLDVDRTVIPVVFCAPDPLGTPLTRSLLPSVVPHAAAAANSARAALLVVALTARPDLLLSATVEYLHQEARRHVMPASMRLVETLRRLGVAAVISGAGPSVLALCTGRQVDEAVSQAPPGWRPIRLAVDVRGAGTERADPGRE
jgi:homoserine kinase